MKPGHFGEMAHPTVGQLALYSTGDLQWTMRWRVGHHVSQCAECEQEVLLFRSAREELRHEAGTETLTGFEAIADWSVLEREMLGNIAVGVAAARCIDKVRRGRKWALRSAFAVAFVALFVAGWMTHIPKQESVRLLSALHTWVGLDRPVVAGTVLRTSPEGISVRTDGATLTIMHPASAVVSVSGASAVSARYVDEETGQVTITKVYAQ